MGEIIVEIFFKYIIAGIQLGLNGIYDWFKGLIFWVPRIEVERKRLEKKWVYKKSNLKRKNWKTELSLGRMEQLSKLLIEKLFSQNSMTITES